MVVNQGMAENDRQSDAADPLTVQVCIDRPTPPSTPPPAHRPCGIGCDGHVTTIRDGFPGATAEGKPPAA